jgi:hypothetical protein
MNESQIEKKDIISSVCLCNPKIWKMEGIITWRWMSLLLLGLLQLNVISITTVDGKSDPFIYSLCNVNKYTNGSDYESNVNTVLKYLVNAAAPRGGFATYSYGQVNGLLQCRGDVSQQDCQKCSAEASEMAYQDCPNAIGARIQLEFCFIRYEKYSFASVLDTNDVYGLENVKSNADIQGFNHTLGTLMKTLAGKAPLNGKRFATGSWVVNSSVTIYGLEMCFRSIAGPDCGVCLREAITDMNECCSSQVGAQVYLGSCTVRFETYPFYNRRT